MTPRNPIDDLFRQRLEQYEWEPSPTLWTSIDQERDWPHRLTMRIRRNRPGVTAFLFLVSAGIGSLFIPQETVLKLSCFPIAPERAGAPPARLAEIPSLASLPVAFSGRTPSPETPARQGKTGAVSEVPPPVVSGENAPLSSLTAPSPEQVAHVQPTVSTLPAESAAVRPLKRVGLLQLISNAPSRELECVRFGRSRDWKLFVEANAGPAYGLRRLESRNGELNQHAGLRRSTETPQLSFSAGVRVSLHTDFGLAVRSGLQYAQLNEKFDYTDNNEEKITITNIYGPGGEIIGTDTLIEKGMRRQISANRYSLIDIPFIAGYEIRRKNWTLAFNGGALFNLSLQARGSFLSPDDQRPTHFASFTSQAGGGAYRNSVDIGWYAGMGVYYKIDDGLQLAVEPNLRYYPQSFTRENYGIRQQYTVASLSIGLRKQI